MAIQVLSKHSRAIIQRRGQFYKGNLGNIGGIGVLGSNLEQFRWNSYRPMTSPWGTPISRSCRKRSGPAVEPCGAPGVICIALDKVFLVAHPCVHQKKIPYLLSDRHQNAQTKRFLSILGGLRWIPYLSTSSKIWACLPDQMLKQSQKKTYKLNIVSFELFFDWFW